MPKSSTPALLEMQVSPLIPFSTSAAIVFSGIPQSPKPPRASVAPSGMSRTASWASFTSFFMILFPPTQSMTGSDEFNAKGGAFPAPDADPGHAPLHPALSERGDERDR